MEEIEEIEEEMPELKKLRLKMWEQEKPDEVMEVEVEIKKKIVNVQKQIKNLVEGKVEKYFKERGEKYKKSIPDYIG